MAPQILWIAILAVATALSWRALAHGGPGVAVLWQLAGIAGLFLFGGEIIAAIPVLVSAISSENAWDPMPRLQLHVAIVALIVCVRPEPMRMAQS